MQEVSPLPDAGGELAIAPAEPLAQTRPQAGTGKWAMAIVISGLLHAAAAAAFLISPAGTFDFQDAEQSEGSDRTGDKVAGSALDKDPSTVNVRLVPSSQPAKPQAEAARPAPPAKPSQPKQEAVNQPPEPTKEAARQPPQPLPEAVQQQAVTPDILVAAAPRPDDQSVAAKAEAPAQPSAQPETTEMPVAVPNQPPIPSARPTPVAPPSKAVDEKRGTADGQDRLAQAASKGKKQEEPGSAAEDSYRGDVIRKLSRVNRAVPPSLQLTARNNAVVTFVISSKGGIDDLRILESSGSPNFDQIVLGIVRKAAPFPPIPPKIGNSMEFTGAIGPF
ncbi:energy transducer TonB [Mesorhizobium loti]|uniref:Energy transducer TonB n=1 Tax=Rhizobium loti TaxID=381 RepID=A0A6M7U992_RHILI|nr:energy transducer TonB [Mesorhizobium sp. Root172]OBQ62384.1 energy transducer TonB [Mesorhizobium loti]QKC73871.1 energy transducer TonB [Mesorhizobium loti]